ncbi:MAG: ribokinase [Alphaproteobacteria bacterium]
MIVVFGSLNADLVFRAGHLPKPGETVIGRSFEIGPGGKGLNQAVAAARAAAPGSAAVRFAGALGDDGFAAMLKATLEAAGIETGALATRPGPSGCAGIVVDEQGENMIVVASGANQAARAAQVPQGWLGPATTLIAQMEMPAGEIAALLFRARREGARTLLNYAPALPLPEEALRAVTLLTLNEIELAMLAGRLGLPGGAPEDAARSVAKALGTHVVVSLGAQGAFAVAGPLAWRIGVMPITPADTTGAGDAFVGALAIALDEGRVLPDALRFASVAGGLSCLQPGAAAAMPSRAAIDARLADLAPAEPA